MNNRGFLKAFVFLLSIPIILITLIWTYAYLKDVGLERNEEVMSAVASNVMLDYRLANQMDDPYNFVHAFDNEYNRARAQNRLFRFGITIPESNCRFVDAGDCSFDVDAGTVDCDDIEWCCWYIPQNVNTPCDDRWSQELPDYEQSLILVDKNVDPMRIKARVEFVK